MPTNGKIFVSHTHADNARCAPLLAALDAWNLDYWFDGQQLDAGQQLSPRLQEAIAQRDILLRVCTVNTPKSYWMNLELGAFRAAEHQQRGKGAARESIDLILDEGFAPGALDRADVTISTLNKPQVIWLAELAKALGVQQSQRRQAAISRRRAIGLGGAALVTVAGLAGSAALIRSRDAAATAPYPTPRTIAFDNPQTLDARIKWRFKAGDGSASALALSKTALIVSGPDGVMALNEGDGDIRWWRTDLIGGDTLGLAVAGDVIYASSQGVSSTLYALRAADGSTIWRTEITSTLGDLGLTQANGVIYMIDDANKVVAFDGRTGSLRWTSPQKLVINGLSARVPLAIGANSIVVGADDGQLLALSTANGATLWSYQTGGAIGSAVAVANGAVYFGSQDDSLYAVNAASGSLLWRYRTSSEILNAPAVSGGMVYICPLDTIMAVDAASGALRWQAKLDASNYLAQSSGPLEMAGDVIYAPANQFLYAFSAQQRAPLWNVKTGLDDTNQTTPVLSGAMAYWASDGGFVYALDTTMSA